MAPTDDLNENSTTSEDVPQEALVIDAVDEAQALVDLSRAAVEKATREVEEAPDSSPGESTDAPNEVKSEVDKNIGFFYALFLSFLNFFLPLYQNLKRFHPCIEKAMIYIESVAQRLEDFFQKHDSIWDIKRDDLVKLMKTAYEEVKSLIDVSSLRQLVRRYVHEGRDVMMYSLDCIEIMQEFVVPVTKGVEPLYKLNREDEYTVRQLCFYIDMNFIHRMFLRSRGFFVNSLRCCAKSAESKPVDKLVGSDECTISERCEVESKEVETSSSRTIPKELEVAGE